MAKKDFGRWPSLLAAASLLVDYVLTVAVSLAAGAASLASVFPAMAHHLLALTLARARRDHRDQSDRNRRVGEGADGPTMVFIVRIFAIIIVGFIRPHPVAVIGA